MALLIISFIAGVLTVLAPCVLPLLPVIIGSSAGSRSKFTPYIVIASLGFSLILFTYLLKVSTVFINIPQSALAYFSGSILLIFGFVLIYPGLWEKLPYVAKLSQGSNKLVGSGYTKKSIWGDIIIGASLGPVFSTCSPTYFVILATVLPVNFVQGSLYLLAYVAGLTLILLFIALLGQRFTTKLNWLANPKGVFKRSLGLLFLIVGIMVISGFDKELQKLVLNAGFLDVTKLEQQLLTNFPE